MSADKNPNAASISKINNEHVNYSEYVKNSVGKVLALGIAEVLARHPSDPIEYLAHWLINYKNNEQETLKTQRIIDEILLEQEKIKKILQKKDMKIAIEQIIEDILKNLNFESKHYTSMNTSFRSEIEDEEKAF